MIKSDARYCSLQPQGTLLECLKPAHLANGTGSNIRYLQQTKHTSIGYMIQNK